ncbi:MAG: SDR family oxidoreductase, partial [Bacteroidota bacterium]|nr:SDR family oxidoreductase [Bacteroidota bacterium]
MQIHRFEAGLEGRVALVTGAAIGNGRAFCERFAEEGAAVAIADIADASETVAAVREITNRVRAYQGDLTIPDTVQQIVEQVERDFGRIDVLVHNVGLYEEEPFELLTFEQWKRMLQVCLDPLFLTAHAVLPRMKRQGFGRIIALSSNTIWLGTPYLVHYVTAKSAIVGFVRSLAAEVGQYGITVNAITVGVTATQDPTDRPMNRTLLKDILPSQCIHRADEPHDIANVVAFLAMPAASIITG